MNILRSFIKAGIKLTDIADDFEMAIRREESKIYSQENMKKDNPYARNKIEGLLTIRNEPMTLDKIYLKTSNLSGLDGYPKNYIHFLLLQMVEKDMIKTFEENGTIYFEKK